MAATLIQNARLVRPGKSVEPGSILLDRARIAQLNPPPGAVAPDADRIDAGGRLLTPGLIDLHFHGIGGPFLEEGPAHFQPAAGMLARYGTTCVLPTLYKRMGRESLRWIESLTEAMAAAKGISFPGFHYEGPFLKLPGAGGATMDGDVGHMKDLVAAAGGRVAAVSISPDTPGILPVIEWLAGRSIAVLMTHTRASAEETEAAIAAGARHATHFYDVFPVPPEQDQGVRPVGAVEAVLADPRVSVDFIADGVHVHPMAIKAALAAKGFAGIVAITDSTFAGTPPGRYDTAWGYQVDVRLGRAARAHAPGKPIDGALAGSTLTMDEAIRNLRRWLPLPSEQVWAMGTSNPARVLGLAGKGSLEVGADADMVLWGEEGAAAMTWVSGELVHEAASYPSPIQEEAGRRLRV